MSLVTIIYLIETLPALAGSFVVFLIWCSVLGYVVASVVCASIKLEDSSITPMCETLTGFRGLVYTVIVFLMLLQFIPSQDTGYKMLAAYGVETIASNDDVQKFAGKSLQVIEKAMASYLTEQTVVEN